MSAKKKPQGQNTGSDARALGSKHTYKGMDGTMTGFQSADHGMVGTRPGMRPAPQVQVNPAVQGFEQGRKDAAYQQAYDAGRGGGSPAVPTSTKPAAPAPIRSAMNSYQPPTGRRPGDSPKWDAKPAAAPAGAVPVTTGPVAKPALINPSGAKIAGIVEGNGINRLTGKPFGWRPGDPEPKSDPTQMALNAAKVQAKGSGPVLNGGMSPAIVAATSQAAGRVASTLRTPPAVATAEPVKKASTWQPGATEAAASVAAKAKKTSNAPVADIPSANANG